MKRGSRSNPLIAHSRTITTGHSRPVATAVCHCVLTAFLATLTAASPAIAQVGGVYDLTWSTIDGGGAMFSAGGNYSLGGTIGQHDAGTKSGGAYELTGGFWPAVVPACKCPGHMLGNTSIRGTDIQAFVNCYVISVGDNCVCADLNDDGLVNAADLSLFVSALLTPGTCP